MIEGVGHLKYLTKSCFMVISAEAASLSISFAFAGDKGSENRSVFLEICDRHLHKLLFCILLLSV